MSEIWLSVPSRKVNLLVVSSSFSFMLWWYAIERMCLRIFAWMNDVVSVLSYGKIAKRSSMIINVSLCAEIRCGWVCSGDNVVVMH